MAFLAGIRVETFDSRQAVVSLPFKYLTRNPFYSIYFACQAMAAEFSTAILCLQNLEKIDGDISFLVTDLKATFTKKATGTVFFSCVDQHQAVQKIQNGITNRESYKFTLESVGKNQQGEKVSTFQVTWSFKMRNR